MEIKNRYTGEVIFSGDYQSLVECVISAIVSGANLSMANLSMADLSMTDLSGACLGGAGLSGANLRGIIGAIQWQAPHGGKRMCISVSHGEKVMHKIGCFWGDTDEASAAIIKKYGENSLYEKIMRLNAEALE